MLSLLLTVCIKEHLSSGFIFLICSISLSDATSKFLIPLSIIVFTTNGCGLVFTAYKIVPGNFFWKVLDANCIEFFLIQYIGSTGFS